MKSFVRERYGHLAEADAFPPGGRARAREAGYPAGWLEGLPARASGAYCGCGFSLEEVELTGAERILDLGCGAGLDARLAAERLGTAGRPGTAEGLGTIGRVLALDMTVSMLARVRESAEGLPPGRVTPLAGDMERLPLRDGAFDLVLANASLNLTIDKGRALAEAARVLRPGGRLIARELVREGELPVDIAQDPTAWNASLGGVLEEAEWGALARAAGFAEVRISHHHPFPPVIAVRIEARRGA
ncbi:MAG: methyltransferase domain-containing protein [bacterium]